MLLVTLTVKKLLERFTERNSKKTNQTEFRIEKIINKKGDRLSHLANLRPDEVLRMSQKDVVWTSSFYSLCNAHRCPQPTYQGRPIRISSERRNIPS